MQKRILACMSLLVGSFLMLAGSTIPSTAITLPKPASMTALTAKSDSLVQKVHGWHCASRRGRLLHRHGRGWHGHHRWHRHIPSCYRRYNYYGPTVYYGIRRSYRSRPWRGRAYRRYSLHYKAPRYYISPRRRYYRGGGVVRGWRGRRSSGVIIRGGRNFFGGYRGGDRGGYRGGRVHGFRR